MVRPRKLKLSRALSWQHVWGAASEAKFWSSCNGRHSLRSKKRIHNIKLFEIRLFELRPGVHNPKIPEMSMQNLAGQQALINSRLKDIIDEIDKNQTLMMRLRSHADSMTLLLKSITSAEQFLNYFSHVNTVLCKYMKILSDNNCKLQVVLNEELMKRNLTYNGYEDFVNRRFETVSANTLELPNEFYNLQFTSNPPEQSNIQDFGYLAGVTNAPSTENFEYAFGGNYDLVNIALDSSDRDILTGRYMQCLSNDLFTYQDLGYPAIANIIENREIPAQDIRITEFNGYPGDEILTQGTNPFLFYGQSDEVMVQPSQPSQLGVNDCEDLDGRMYYDVATGETQFYSEENEEQDHVEVKQEQKGGEQLNTAVRGEPNREEEQSPEGSDEQAGACGIQSESNASVNDSEIEASTNNASSQDMACSLPSEAEQDHGKNSDRKTREYSAEVTHVVSPSEIYVRLVQESCPLLQKLMDEIEALKTDEEYARPYFPPLQKSKKENRSRLKKLGKYALYYSETDNKFFRTQILDESFGTTDNMVSVRLVDTGTEDRVNLMNIYPMSEKLEKFPRFAVNCYLAEISSDDPESPDNWSPEDIEFVKEWISKNDRVTIVVDESARKDGKPLPILLYDLEKSRCLNDEIRERKSKGNQNFYKVVLDNWDPMLEAHESQFNTYDFDHDDPSCVIYGYVAKDYERICKIYRRTGRCFKGEGCRKEHVPLNSSGYTTDQEEVFINAFNSLPTPAIGEKLKIEITHVVNGAQFHCIMVQGTGYRGETLRSLVAYMNRKDNVSKMKRISIPPALGQIVIARYSVDRFWYRAKVVEVIPENDEYTVIFLDYGNEEAVSLSDLRLMAPNFLHLPFQAMLCYIDGVTPAPDALEESMEYLNKFSYKTLEIEVVSLLPGFTPNLIVRLFDEKGEDVRDIMLRRKLAIPHERLILDEHQIIPG